MVHDTIIDHKSAGIDRRPLPSSMVARKSSGPESSGVSAKTSAALYAEQAPRLGSALLHHRDRCVTEEHCNRASSLSAASAFGRLIKGLQSPPLEAMS